MSKYTVCETKLEAKHKDVLREAILRVLKMKFQINASEGDVEFHQEAANLIGYQGDIRQEKANIIIRGSGVDRASAATKQMCKVSGKNALPGAYNDLGLIENNGYYQIVVQDFDKERIHDFKVALHSMVNSLNVARHFEAHKAKNPGVVLQILDTGEIIEDKELFIKKLFEANQKGERLKVKFIVPKQTGLEQTKTQLPQTEFVPTFGAPVKPKPILKPKDKDKEKGKQRGFRRYWR